MQAWLTGGSVIDSLGEAPLLMSSSPLLSPYRLLSWSQLVASYSAWQDCDAEVKQQCFLEWCARAHPWMETAVASVSARHHLLGDFASILPRMQQALHGLKGLKKSVELQTIWLESMALKLIKLESAETVVPIGVPNAPWHGFRRRVNTMVHSDRLLLMASLPRCSEAPFLGDTPVLPDSRWLELWKGVSDGVPPESLPTPWKQYLREHAPATVAERQGSDLILPSSGAAPRRRLILPNRKMEKEFGKVFYSASAWSESGHDSPIRLLMPKGVIPCSGSLFLQQIRVLLKKNGGLPKDAFLREPLEEMIHHLRSGRRLDEGMMSPMRLQEIALGLGHDLRRVEELAAAHHFRRLDFASSQMAWQRALAHAETPQDVATALANLAGLRFWQNDATESGILLKKALHINPWSRIAQANLKALRETTSSWEAKPGELTS
jgi:hypothetical protein